jgi:nicotinamide riboside kinase
MLVVNLFGGPGTGKSTLAAALFSNLKIKGVNVELVTEFAKDLVWSERNKELQDQVYILGKMYHKLWRLKDKVDVVVIDSPLPLCVYYDQGKTPGMEEFVEGLFNQFKNINILLERNFPYQQEGRYQDESGAVKVHNDIYKLLDALNIKFTKCLSPEITASSTQYAIFVDNIANSVTANLGWMHK